MGRSEQETSRKILREKGLLEEKKKGVPARLHYRINLIELEKFLVNQQKAESCQLAGEDPPCCKEENDQLDGGIPPAITESTPSTPPEKTTTTTDGGSGFVFDDYQLKVLIKAGVASADDEKRQQRVVLAVGKEVDVGQAVDTLCAAFSSNSPPRTPLRWLRKVVAEGFDPTPGVVWRNGIRVREEGERRYQEALDRTPVAPIDKETGRMKMEKVKAALLECPAF